MRRICRIFAVVAALAVPGSAAAQAPLLAVATNWSPWLDPHVFAYAPGASLRALAPGIAGVGSPDGTRLAFVRDGRLWVSAANGADAHPLAGVPAAEPVAGSLAWSPDGARVGYVAYGESVVLADPDSGAATTIARATAFAWSPEDSRVVYATAEPTPRLVVARTDGSDTRTLAAFDSVTGLAWSRSGTIAVAGVHGPAGVWLVDAATGAVRGLDLRVRASSPAWSPDGTSLAYLRSARGIPRTVVVARGGRSRALGTLPGNAFGDVAWSADGRRLAAAASGALLVGSPRAHAHAYRLPPAARLADPGVAVSWLGRSLVVSGRADPERADTELALVRADGSGYRVLTHDGRSFRPVFAPSA